MLSQAPRRTVVQPHAVGRGRWVSVPARLCMLPMRLPLLAVAVLAPVLGACAPRLGPVYRDYAVPAPLARAQAADSVRARARAALLASGWTVVATDPALQTNFRDGGDRLLYRNRMAVSVFPIGPNHVRVQYQPVRRYTARMRTFLTYLTPGLARPFLPTLDAALRARGFTPIPSGPRKDRD